MAGYDSLPARFAALVFSLAGASAASAAPLQGSEWKPWLIDDNPVPPETSAFLRFHSKGRLLGFSGCNELYAEYQAEDGHILVGPVAATRTTCAGSVMAREAALAAVLEDARTYRRIGARLVLFDGSGRPVLEMRQTDWN